MFCKYCGNKLSENSKFCTQCGAQLEEVLSNEQPVLQNNLDTSPVNNTPTTFQQPSEEITQPQQKRSGKATAGFVLSLVGLLFAGIICGLLGVIFSSIGLKDVCTKNLKGKGLAVAGLIISIIDIVGAILYALLPY